MSISFLTDNVSEATAIVRKHRLTVNDAGFRGELKRLSENAGIRAQYFSRDGLTVDDMCELIGEIAHERPSCNEFLEWFEDIAIRRIARKSGITERPDWNGAEDSLRRAQSNRHRVYRCPSCAQQVRGSRSTVVLCGVCRDDAGFPVRFVRTEPLPEEITTGHVSSAVDCPF